MNTQKEKIVKFILENWKVSGENSNELAGEIADILIRYEEEGKGIEEDLKDKIQAEIEEEDIDIRKEVRGFEK